MINILSGLNIQQKNVILNSLDCSSLTLAGAGSGKTKVLTIRTKYLINKLKISPASIITITFTRKAANELKDRLNLITSKEELDTMWIGTYHSICLRLLDMFGEKIGLKDGYTILDSYNSKKCASDILIKMGLEVDKKTITNYLKRVSSLKNNLVFPKTFREKVLKKYSGNGNDLNSSSDYVFAEFYSKYQKENMKNNTIDFDDMILYTVLLLISDAEAMSYVKNRFKYVSADEVQDSNVANMVLLNLLSKHGNLFMVGDEDQAIYGFRGAVSNLSKDYINKKDGAKIFKLEQNYRSTANIVEASNAVISNNKNRINKVCFSKNGSGNKIKFHVSKTNISEAEYIAREIKSLVNNKNKTLNDVTVLYRTNAQSRVLEEVFIRENIKYTLIGSKTFTERAEIKDCMAVLKLSCNLKDKYSFKRVLKTLSGVGEKTISDLEFLLDVHGDVIKALNLYKPKSKKAKKSLTFLLEILKLIDKKTTAVLDKIAKYYIDKLEEVDDDKSQERIDNIKELQKMVLEKENDGITINEFITQMDLISPVDIENKKGEDSVTLMTIHASKGTENDTVFLVGFNDKILPHENSYKSKDGEEEERRLLYVAMTRAKKNLYISRYAEDSKNSYEESIFFKEIPNHYLEYSK